MVKLRLEEVLSKSPKDVLWTSPDSLLCNAKGVPSQHPEDAPYRRPQDVER